jgi:hypothetical protein
MKTKQQLKEEAWKKYLEVKEPAQKKYREELERINAIKDGKCEVCGK